MMHLGVIKTELQSWGVRIPFKEKGRKGGAGPAEGRTLLLGKSTAMVPIQSEYVKKSPYTVEERNGEFILLRNEAQILSVDFPNSPKFYELRTEDGIPYQKIALLHGKDCLASTVYQDCIYWDSPLRCKFCGIKLSLENGQTIQTKSSEQLAEVVTTAYELDHIRHVTLTTGTTNSTDKGIRQLAEATTAIKKKSALPIHVQCEPPSEPHYLDMLYESGVDTVGIHIESFDFDILSSIAPAKAKIGVESFKRTWERAVELFGRNQVSSFIIVGLGESLTSVLEGSELLAKQGVYPFVVPLRPIPGTHLEHFVPPPPEQLTHIYKHVANTIKHYNLSARNCKAGCVRCSACSALPDFEQSG